MDPNQDRLDFEHLIDRYFKIKNPESFLKYLTYVFYDISIKKDSEAEYLDKIIFSQVNIFFII
jgi:hypothetical protein